MTDNIRIGYKKDNKVIPLGRLCYALLYGREEELFPLNPKDIHFREEELDIDDDSNEKLFNNPKCMYFNKIIVNFF